MGERELRTETVSSPDGTPIVYHHTGSGPTVLVVHGTLATTEMYAPIASLLATDHHVVLMERRGYRVSGDGARPGTFDMQAADIAAVLDTVDEPRYVFGHSAGGMATIHALASIADRVRAVALYEPPATLAGPPLLPTLAKCREQVESGRNADAVVTFLTAVGGPDPAIEQIAPFLARSAHCLIEDLECMTSTSTEPGRWPTGDLPILLMAGGNSDEYGRASVARLARELSAPDTIVLPGQGHSPDDPVPVAAALREFFAKH
jgi:pimeloyl-ACP methyl ester carboxylesterase